MSQEQRPKQDTASIRNDLLKAIAVCEERIKVSKQNEVRYEKLKSDLDNSTHWRDSARETANHLSRMYKNVKFFLENKKSASKAIMEESIRSAATIVKDAAGLCGCTIQHDNGKTRIYTENGDCINKIEGSAAKATMGLLLRYTCLKALPNKIQIMFLDEALAPLSSNTAVNIRELLEILSKNIGIVGIEQRAVSYTGLSIRMYEAVKIGKDTKIYEGGVK